MIPFKYFTINIESVILTVYVLLVKLSKFCKEKYFSISFAFLIMGSVKICHIYTFLAVRILLIFKISNHFNKILVNGGSMSILGRNIF